MTTAVIIYYLFSFLFMIGVNLREKEFNVWMGIWLWFFAWTIFPIFWGDYFTTKRTYYENYQKVEE